MREGGAMTSYRFYFIGASNKVEGAQNHDVKDDAEARARAHAELGDYTFTSAIEIWDTNRFVARVTRSSRDEPSASTRT